ncbi:MAG: hypothetical protein WB870_03350 [Gallionellaceae bacterium]
MNTLDNPFFNMPEPTEAYIMENQYVNSLERRIINTRSRLGTNHALITAAWYIGRKVKSILTYASEVVTYREWLTNLLKLRNNKVGTKALVIGNGPSQGYMKVEFLNAFKHTGGEVFVVNFWNQNQNLSAFKPDYLVISDPATLRFEDDAKAIRDNNLSLLNYLECNATIKVICPFPRCREISKMLGAERVIGFTDTELQGITGNISPIYPRGYISMTLYKALAVALFFGYKDIYVIGMDNTYPRNIYCDEQNRILNLEKHSGTVDTVVDQSSLYPCVSALLKELATLFLDARKFARSGIVKNLDRYSLTDAFPKVRFDDVIGEGNRDIHLMIHERLTRDLV